MPSRDGREEVRGEGGPPGGGAGQGTVCAVALTRREPRLDRLTVARKYSVLICLSTTVRLQATSQGELAGSLRRNGSLRQD